MLQIISAVIKDSEDTTNLTLLFANQVNLSCSCEIKSHFTAFLFNLHRKAMMYKIYFLLSSKELKKWTSVQTKKIEKFFCFKFCSFFFF